MRDSSYNIVVDRLQKFAEGHFYIKSFAHGTLDALDTTKSIEYPIMQVIPGTMTPSQGQVAYSFDIVFADLARRKTDLELNTREIISDMTRIALDLLVEIKNGQVLFGSDVQVEQGSVITSFIDGYENTITGVTLAITIIVQDTWNACIIPADWSTGGTGYPSEGMRVTSIPVLDEGDFVVNAYEIDFRGSGVTVTRTGNTAIVTITGGGGGGGITCEDLPTCEVVVDINDAIDTLTSSLSALGSTVSSLSATVVGIQNDITAIEAEQTTQNDNITALQNDLTALSNSLATVATTGDYNDLINLPDLNALNYVNGVTGFSVDNTDPLNPVVKAIPTAGTNTGEPVTGDIEFNSATRNLYSGDLLGDYSRFYIESNGVVGLENKVGGTFVRFNVQSGKNAFLESDFSTFKGLQCISDEQYYELSSLIALGTLKKRFWAQAGAPTVLDGGSEGYIIGSLLFDTTTGLLYKCTDATLGAAVWVRETFGGFQNYTVSTGVGVVFPASSTRWYTLDGVSANPNVTNSQFVIKKALRAGVFSDPEIITGTAQPASGSITYELYAGATPSSLSSTGVSVTIPAGSAAGIYTGSGTYTIPQGEYYAWRIVNGATGNSGQFVAASILLTF